MNNIRKTLIIIGKCALMIFNIIAGLASIVGLVYTFFDGASTQTFVFVFGGIVCAVGLFSIWGFRISTKNDRAELGIVYSECFHKLLHDIRNLLEEDDLNQKVGTFRSARAYRKNIIENSINIMDILSRKLSSVFNIKIRACVKLFDFISPTGEIEVITFARNGVNANTVLREQREKIDVNKNSDFKYIFENDHEDSEDEHSFFFQEDLIKYAKKEKKAGREYCNTTKNWEKKYATTIVMPIRCLVYNPKNGKAYYDIIGYLCVDSKNTKAFKGGYQTFIVELLKGTADILYHYYSGCTEYYKTLTNQGIGDNKE